MFQYRHISLTTALRVVIGLIWLAGAAVNLSWTLRHPSVITDALASDATFRVFRSFFGDIVDQAPMSWILMLIMTELGLGLLTLSRGQWARAGLAGSALFSLFLFFVIWPYTLMMGAFALLCAWLIRFPHQLSVIDLFHRRNESGLHTTGSGA